MAIKFLRYLVIVVLTVCVATPAVAEEIIMICTHENATTFLKWKDALIGKGDILIKRRGTWYEWCVEDDLDEINEGRTIYDGITKQVEKTVGDKSGVCEEFWKKVSKKGYKADKNYKAIPKGKRYEGQTTYYIDFEFLTRSIEYELRFMNDSLIGRKTETWDCKKHDE